MRIISDGTTHNTKFLTNEGEDISGELLVRDLIITGSYKDGMVEAILHVLAPRFEITPNKVKKVLTPDWNRTITHYF